MPEQTAKSRWTDARWLAEVNNWIGRSLDLLGIRRTEDLEQPHVRPWATALRIPTSVGPLWFKATVSGLGHEAATTHALSLWTPGQAPEVLAADPERNWMLMRDGGATLRAALSTIDAPAAFRQLAIQYAQLQQSMTPRVPQLLAAGVPDCRLSVFPEQYRGLLAAAFTLDVAPEDALLPEEKERLLARVPGVESAARELAEFGIPETLQHDDLHSNNVFLNESGLQIFDWGDCSISHPFYSLVVLLRGMAYDLRITVQHDAMQSVRQAYLDAWQLDLDERDLNRACEIAGALGRISRALTWLRLLPALDPEAAATWSNAVPGWLKETLKVEAALTQPANQS